MLRCLCGRLCHHAVNCLVDCLCVRARACTNKAWQTGARRSWWWKVMQVVVHARDRRSSRLRWSAAAVSAAAVEEESLVLERARAQMVDRPGEVAVKQTCSEYTDVC